MADPFSFISESDDSAVEDIISQAIDHCVLEQISSINCSSFSNSVLPSDLETRFHKLKSFPGANPKSKPKTRAKTTPPPPPPPPSIPIEPQNEESSTSLNHCENDKPLPTSSPDEVIITTQTQKTELQNPDPTQTSSGQAINGSKHKSRSGYVSSPCGLSESSSDAEGSSPPRQNCCFWYSPKKVSTKEKKKKKKKKKENWVSGIGLDPLDWEQNDEYLSDLRSFSLKEQRRKLKKALKEEEKINREAEKIVEWAKQASARIDFSAIEELLSDEEKSD